MTWPSELRDRSELYVRNLNGSDRCLTADESLVILDALTQAEAKLKLIRDWAENRDPSFHGMEQDSPHTDRFFHGYSVALDRALELLGAAS